MTSEPTSEQRSAVANFAEGVAQCYTRSVVAMLEAALSTNDAASLRSAMYRAMRQLAAGLEVSSSLSCSLEDQLTSISQPSTPSVEDATQTSKKS